MLLEGIYMGALGQLYFFFIVYTPGGVLEYSLYTIHSKWLSLTLQSSSLSSTGLS